MRKANYKKWLKDLKRIWDQLDIEQKELVLRSAKVSNNQIQIGSVCIWSDLGLPLQYHLAKYYSRNPGKYPLEAWIDEGT
jgi:hypothetical protein